MVHKLEKYAGEHVYAFALINYTNVRPSGRRKFFGSVLKWAKIDPFSPVIRIGRRKIFMHAVWNRLSG